MATLYHKVHARYEPQHGVFSFCHSAIAQHMNVILCKTIGDHAGQSQPWLLSDIAHRQNHDCGPSINITLAGHWSLKGLGLHTRRITKTQLFLLDEHTQVAQIRQLVSNYPTFSFVVLTLRLVVWFHPTFCSDETSSQVPRNTQTHVTLQQHHSFLSDEGNYLCLFSNSFHLDFFLSFLPLCYSCRFIPLQWRSQKPMITQSHAS